MGGVVMSGDEVGGVTSVTRGGVQVMMRLKCGYMGRMVVVGMGVGCDNRRIVGVVMGGWWVW